jgi:hypothetical protein
MSNLITVQNENTTDDYVVRRKNKNKKTPRKTNHMLVPILQAHQNTKKDPTERLKETKSH